MQKYIFQISELERDAREDLNSVKDSIGQAKHKLESDVLAESMQIAHLKVPLLTPDFREQSTHYMLCIWTRKWVLCKIRRIALLFDKNSPLQKIFVYEPMKKDPELLDSTLN